MLEQSKLDWPEISKKLQNVLGLYKDGNKNSL